DAVGRQRAVGGADAVQPGTGPGRLAGKTTGQRQKQQRRRPGPETVHGVASLSGSARNPLGKGRGPYPRTAGRATAIFPGIKRRAARRSLFLRLLPDRAVDFLVERRAARGELALVVVLGAHQGGAVAEGAADALAVEAAVLLELPHEVRLREGGAADAHERH